MGHFELLSFGPTNFREQSHLVIRQSQVKFSLVDASKKIPVVHQQLNVRQQITMRIFLL